MLLLGIDIGSSSVKASVIDGSSGRCLASVFHPQDEMKIVAARPGWAEQDPAEWWKNLKASVAGCRNILGNKINDVGAVGISYQMHGLVIVDKGGNILRPSIIWCDSRAVDYGSEAFRALGEDFCLSHLLNSPGNFTAAKLAWVKDNEPDIYNRIYKIMLPGDYIAMKLTGEILTTYSGLSEGIFWDFASGGISRELMNYFGFSDEILPKAVPSFSLQGQLTSHAADELGLVEGIPVSYRAGDQPNNALSLNVLEPGEVAATAGTSGVIYGVTDQKKSDPRSRVNTFLHVNHSDDNQRLGVLLCINGTGILNSWLKRSASSDIDYNGMNKLASTVLPGSEGLTVLPFGNGAERMLLNQDAGCLIAGLEFNRHSNAHLYRSAQEGIAFSFRYGLDIMRETGMAPQRIRAGEANMFLSPVFREALSCITGVEICLYNTDGSAGAARGAGIGCGYYKTPGEAFSGLSAVGTTVPDPLLLGAYEEAYSRWKSYLGSLNI